MPTTPSDGTSRKRPFPLVLLQIALSRRIVRNSLKISLVVGTILNLINQWEYIAAGNGLMIGHLALNYLVPYCVATYSATQFQIQQMEEREAAG